VLAWPLLSAGAAGVVAVVAVVAVIGRLRRSAVLRRADAAYAARFSTGADGVVAGAESFTLRAPGGRALLLLHGSGDSPQTLRYLGEALHAAGYTVHAPLLPGHGRRPSAFVSVSARVYREALETGLDLVRREASWIGVVGLSMGGALAAQVAADAADVRALVLLVPYVEPTPLARWVARLAPAWGLFAPCLDGRGEGSVQDVAARGASRAYGVFTPAAMRALVETATAGQRALSRVTVPTLVVHSREDIRIPTAIAERATAALRGPTERRWVTGCGHVITVDHCKAEVARLVVDFLAPLTRD
jgi:carboxylesterase